MFFSRNALPTLLVSVAFAALPALAEISHTPHEHGADATAAAQGHDRGTHMFEGAATVVAVDLAAHKIGLDHGPVPALKWPAMRMAFKVDGGVDLTKFNKGDRVQFTLHKVEKGAYPIVELCASSSAEVVPGLCAPQASAH